MNNCMNTLTESSDNCQRQYRRAHEGEPRSIEPISPICIDLTLTDDNSSYGRDTASEEELEIPFNINSIKIETEMELTENQMITTHPSEPGSSGSSKKLRSRRKKTTEDSDWTSSSSGLSQTSSSSSRSRSSSRSSSSSSSSSSRSSRRAFATQTDKEPDKPIPRIFIGRINKSGGVRQLHRRVKGVRPAENRSRHERETSVPQQSGPLTLNSLLDGRRLMRKNRTGLYTSQINWSPIYISSYIMKEFEACSKHIKTTCGFETLETAQNILNKGLREQFPFGCCFRHQSALKMAEIDHVSGYQFTQPKTLTGQSLLEHNEILYFCDLAGGPGGTAEYILWKRKYAAKGWGLSRLDPDRHYNLSRSPSVHPEYFDAYYGPEHEMDSDDKEKGSFLDRNTVIGYIDMVRRGSDFKGAHVVTTMGSFNTLGNSKDNENRWKPILLSQIYIALKVLRKGGNFVLKMFDAKTNYSAALIFFLFKTFDDISFRKPFTSVPGSSERAVICIGRKSHEEIHDIIGFLGDCHNHMCSWKASTCKEDNHRKYDILVSDEFLMSCDFFISKLKETNDNIKIFQMQEIQDILTCRAINSHRYDELKRQRAVQMEKLIFEEWKLERNTNNIFRPRADPQLLLANIGAENIRDLNFKIVNFNEAIKLLNPYNKWKFVPVGNVNGSYGVYIGTGGRFIYKLEKDGQLIEVKDLEEQAKFVLAKGTVVVGELRWIEKRNKIGEMEHTYAFYIIDGMMLGGLDIRKMPYEQRILECEKYAKAVTQYHKSTYAEVRVRKSYELKELCETLQNLEDLENEDESSDVFTLKMTVNTANSHNWGKTAIEATGVIFFPTGSRSIPSGFHPDFLNTVLKSVVWKWSRLELLSRKCPDNVIMRSLVRRGMI